MSEMTALSFFVFISTEALFAIGPAIWAIQH